MVLERERTHACAYHGKGSTGEHEVDHPQREPLADAARWMVCSILVPRQLLGLLINKDGDLKANGRSIRSTTQQK